MNEYSKKDTDKDQGMIEKQMGMGPDTKHNLAYGLPAEDSGTKKDVMQKVKDAHKVHSDRGGYYSEDAC